MTQKKGIVVAISRQMGSGGSYIGYSVANELGFKLVDREILRRAAEQLGTDEKSLEGYEERSSSLLENIMRMFSFGTPEAVYVPPSLRPVYDKDLFALECKIMNEIADKNNAVIIGRGGFYALKDRPDLLRVFIHAPREFRIKRVMKVDNVTDMREARAKVEESDQRRARFIREMIGVEWTDAENYDLSIDSSTIGFPAGIEMITNLVKKKERAQ
jgi:cytidylate kinase